MRDLMETIQDNLLAAFDHLNDEEKTVMCQIVVDAISHFEVEYRPELTKNQENLV